MTRVISIFPFSYFQVTSCQASNASKSSVTAKVSVSNTKSSSAPTCHHAINRTKPSPTTSRSMNDSSKTNQKVEKTHNHMIHKTSSR